MTTRREVLAALGGLLPVMALQPPSAAAAVRDSIGAAVGAGLLEHHPDFPSRQVLARDVWVWRPPGYAATGPVHDVLYFHDGANLFEPGRAFGGEEWGVDETLASLIASGSVPPTLVVGIGNTRRRFREYMPEGLWSALPVAQRAAVTCSHGGEPLSARYLRFITRELVPWVQSRYRVSADPARTHIAGSSMGGLISLAALVEHPEVFGSAGCLSTHWPCLAPSSLDPRPAAEVAGVAEALRQWVTPHLPALRGHRLYLDRGDATLDVLYPPFQDRVDAWLATVAAPAGLRVTSRVFPGGEHSERAWRARLAEPLRFLLNP